MIRKAIAIILIVLVLFFTVLSILAIWDLINIQHVLSKSLSTLLVITISTAVMLFIFAVLYKPDNDPKN
jgi:glucan phosphoethanolaminetransferase (alkaline phosphatase superfamily)